MESLLENIRNMTLQMPPFIMAVIFHEYAHGLVAYRWGDSTARDQGRLTLNPVPHIDPIGTLLFPIINMVTGIPILIGWAKPVPINPNRFRKYRPGLFWTSLAGPSMNFILAVFSAIMYFALSFWVPRDFYLYDPLRKMAEISVMLNFALGLFNLIPLPPLDGSKIVESFLSYEATRKYEALSRYSFFILIALLMSGAFRVLEYPIRLLTAFAFMFAAKLFGIPVMGGLE